MSMQWVIEALRNRSIDMAKRRDIERRESLLAAFGDDAAATERCDVCNSELSQCGDMCVDGPEMDCLPCRLRARVAELEAENKAHRDVQDGARAIVARCNKRVAELEAENKGIMATWEEQAGLLRADLSDARIRIAELESNKVSRLPLYCTYCSFSTPPTEGCLERIQQHVQACDFHPMGQRNRALTARVEELEAERGIPARCPECGHVVAVDTMVGVECHFTCVVFCLRCDYVTNEYATPEDAWRGHQTNVDAKEAKQ